MERYLPEFGILAILNLMLLFIKNGKYYGLRFIAAVALFAAFFATVMFAQLPYIIYPTVTIVSAFTDPASASIMLGALGVALIFLIPALFLLYRLFGIKK